MDFGLYQTKYPARKLINGILPLVHNVNPNIISLLLLPVGIVTAIILFLAVKGAPHLYLTVIALILLRMFLGTLDGLVAEHYHKSTPLGEILNRLTPEICDTLYLVALTLALPEWATLGIIAIAISWLTSFTGLIGLTVNKPIQSVGPVGQTDRLAALILFALGAYVSSMTNIHIDFIQIFLIWSIAGGIITTIIRLKRNCSNDPKKKE